jgi:hypothetical protein
MLIFHPHGDSAPSSNLTNAPSSYVHTLSPILHTVKSTTVIIRMLHPYTPWSHSYHLLSLIHTHPSSHLQNSHNRHAMFPCSDLQHPPSRTNSLVLYAYTLWSLLLCPLKNPNSSVSLRPLPTSFLPTVCLFPDKWSRQSYIGLRIRVQRF